MAKNDTTHPKHRRLLQSPQWKLIEDANVEVCREVAKFFKKVGVGIEFNYKEEKSSAEWIVPDYIQDDFVPKLIGTIRDIWESTFKETTPTVTQKVIEWLKTKEKTYDDEGIRNLIWKILTQK